MPKLTEALGGPPIPREHGAWAMLATAVAFGLARARGVSAGALLVAAALVLLFLARGAAIPALARARERRPLAAGFLRKRFLWAGIYLAGALACLWPALDLATPHGRGETIRAALVPLVLGATHAALGVAGRDRTLLAELLAMTGLAATAPLVVAAAGRPVDVEAAGVAALALLYFLSSLSFVRAYRRIRSHGAMATGSCIAVHAALLLALVVLVRAGWLPAAAWLAFAPIAVRTAWGLVRPPRDLRVLGWNEVAVATLFVFVAVFVVARSS